MRVHINLILTGIFLLTGWIADLSGQSNKSCGHDHAQTQLFETPEAFEKAKADVMKGAYSKYLRNSGQKNNSTITIPVVFHIIHVGEAEGVGSNLPAGRVQAQLDVLNEDFSASNANYSDVTRPAWDAIKGNPLISFCLATKDPNGITTTGIVRHDIEITGSDANNNNIETVKAGIFWDSDDYMNVFVLSIPGTDASGGVVGYAYLPYFGTVGTAQDGIVVDYNWFGGDGYPQSGAKTLTHEVGHYLGLFHTFNGSSCSEDDGLNDTPNMDNATSNIDASLSCGNAMNPYPTGPTSCGNEHMYINYMDYVNDENCPTSFTVDQVAIMRGVLEGTAPLFTTRAPLVSNASTACIGAPSCDLAASTSSTGTTCNDTEDGSATVTATDGTAPYTYAWSTSPTQTSVTATGLAPGTYFVTITDSGGCTVVNSAIIEAASGLSVVVDATDESIRGAEDGTVSASPSGGTPGYAYQWDNGLTTASGYNGLSPGTYDVTVTDSLGCTTIGSGVVDQGPCDDLVVSASTADVECNGESNGYASITVTTGVGPYTYNWDGVIYGNERFNLAALTHSVIVTDSEGCRGVVTFTINQPSALLANTNSTDLTGVGNNDGTVTATGSGGTPAYNYTWSNGGGNVAMINNLSPGTYSVTITDINNCTATSSSVVEDYDCADFDIALSGGELFCVGDTSTLSVSSIASTGPYSYSWSTGETTDAIAINAGGTYSVSVQDGNGCTSSESKVITDAPSGMALSFTSFAESAPNANDGRIETQVEGGTPSYTYQWSTGATSVNIENLAPGSYSFTATDANNCSEIGSATISEFVCSSFPISFTTIDASCHGSADGAIDANPAGAAPFTYIWSNGDTSEVNNNLAAATYTVTVTDLNGCTENATATVAQPIELNITLDKTDESGEDTNDGQITTTVTGGIPGYSYAWSDGSTALNRMDLPPGTYTVTVTDNTLCSNSAAVTIGEYNCSEIIIAPTITHVGCAGDASGAITLDIIAMTAPYTVLWSNGSTEEQVTGLTAGSYSVTLTDGGGCELLRTFTLTESTPLSANATSIPETANNSNDGSASITADGGTAPFDYAWSNGGATSEISNLTPGDYIATVTDANGCVHIDSVEVEAYICPPFDITSMNKTDNLCSGDANGTLGASISGGTPLYEFNWSNGSTTAVIDVLIAGEYSVTITDSKNCTVSGSASLIDPAQLVLTNSVSHVSSIGASDGSVSLAIQGGTSPYGVIWNTGETTENINNLDEGTYAYTVTDNNGCSSSGEVIIEQYVCPDLTITFETTNITCNGADDGALRAIVDGGTAPYSYLWSTSATDDLIDALIVGTYNVTATDAKGCNISNAAPITEPQQLSSSAVVTHETGGNERDGSAEINITGGTMPYEVMWTDEVEGALRTDMSPDTYAYAVLDANRCVTTGELVIDEFDCPSIVLSITVFDNECEDGDVGGVEVEVSNGTAPFTYQLNGAIQEGPSIRGLSAGLYELTVADINGCSATMTFDVENPMPMVIDEIVTEDTSGNLPGSATVTVLGGSEPYSYVWSDGRTNESNNALFPGIHYVSITDAFDCILVQEVIIHQLEDIDSIEDLQLFESHPNPASEMVGIQVEFSVAKDIRILITNISGQPVFDELLNTDVYNRQVDISGYPRGLYKINIYTADEMITKSLAIF